jgi:hypothetical protein
VTLRDGRELNHFTRFAPGTKENPLDAEGVNAKVRDLIVPVVGVRRSDEIIRAVHAIETFDNMNTLVRLLTQA